MELPATGHDPILVEEIRDLLGFRAGGVYLDCTLGRAGHARAFAETLGNTGLIVGIDTDVRNLKFAKGLLAGPPPVAPTVRLFHANFADVAEVWRQISVKDRKDPGTPQPPLKTEDGVDFILADLGVSTNQLFEPGYGMSMSVDGPLDMRLDPAGGGGVSAAEIINRWEEGQIADILYQLADERFSRRIARKILAERKIAPILTTGRLADIVRSAVGRRSDSSIDPATRTFQALRMEANREVENLEKLLQVAPPLLRRGGRVAIMSFHSGEDRRVKESFRALEAGGAYRVVTRKVVTPTEAEIERNPRSRSAKLRVLERL